MGILQKSCITDIPVAKPDEDTLNSGQYAAALCKFIRNADTPVTLGIQGGWGSGKTSLFSLLREKLEHPKKEIDGKANDKYEQEMDAYKAHPTVCVTVNAWEHALFQSEDNKASVVLSILSSLVKSITELGNWEWLDRQTKENFKNESTNTGSILKTMGKVMPTLLNVGMQFFVPGFHADIAKAADQKEKGEEEALPVLAEQIHSLKERLDTLVGFLKYDGKPVKVVIFIDDLDRVPPPTAVEILDVTKNIFDIKNCIFVLAIDYEVIVKGLEKKFGERTDKNEREFRQYFDKIIQIPFTMPIGAFSKQINKMLKNALMSLDYNFSEEQEKSILDRLSLTVKLATGGIPRSIKRIVNTFSLLDYIAEAKNTSQ